MYYVFVPKKTKPRSQKRPDMFYGGFSSVENANVWKKEKGLDIYPTVLVVSDLDMEISPTKLQDFIKVEENQ